MSSDQPTRTVFLPTGKWYEIHIDTDPDAPSPSKKPRTPPLRIPTYALVTYTDDQSPDVEGQMEFCCLGKDYEFKYIPIYVLESRLQTRNARTDDYEALQESRGVQVDFQVWNNNATISGIPKILRVDPKQYPNDPDAWDAEQLANWRTVARAATRPYPKPYNTYMRFCIPPKGVTVYLTPNEAVIDLGELKLIVEGVLKDPDNELPTISYEVLTYQNAEGRGLKLVGSHFLQFYDTWMKPNEYEAIWNARGTIPLPRDFPGNAPKDQEPFREIQAKLKVPKDRADVAPETAVNSRKAYIGKLADRQNYDDQIKVMNNTSATVLSDKFWPDPKPKPEKKKKHIAEWLHRNAFRFGGLGDSVNVATSQHPGNLVFGSKECNTHMIRAENTISKFFSWERGLTGSITTTNVRHGFIKRLEDNGERTNANIPTWTKDHMYSWLCFRLDYGWSMQSMLLNMPCNVSVVFDPWSRYLPLKLEAHLDDAVIDYLYSPIATVHLPSTSTKPRLVQLSSAGNPPSNPILGWRMGGASVWQAAKARHVAVTVNGITVLNPRIPLPLTSHALMDFNEEYDLSPPDSGFVLEGEINLFGISTLVAELEMWVGPPPDDVDVGDNPPEIERATLKSDFHLSQVIPQLKETVFDTIIFRNVTFYYQNYAFDKTKAIGWHFNADWVIDDSCGFLYDLLSTGLNVERSVLSIHAGLGLRQSWDSPLKIHSVTLEGVFADLTFSPIEGLCFTSIGVRLFGIRELAFNPNPRYVLKYGFGVFGTMNLDVPSSIVPLTLDYDMTVTGKTIRLSAAVSGDIWNEPLGVEDLSLQNVLFAASFSLPSPWKSLAFDISATFQYKLTRTILLGSYTIGGPFTLTAVLKNVDATFINNVFELISCDMLVLPEFEIKIETATISITSGMGLSISLQNVVIEDYKVARASLSISSMGVVLFGELTGKVLQFGEVSIGDPFLKVAFAPSSTRKKTDVIVGGVVDFFELSLKVAAHLYRGAKGIEWTMLAEVSVNDLSEIVPAVKHTFLDLALKNVLFVFASQDDPSLEDAVYSRYTFRKGFHIYATIDQMNTLNDLMRQPVPGLVLCVGWSEERGFNMDVLLPAELSLDLGNGIRTTPIELGIITRPSVELSLSAGLSVPVANSPDSLIFSLILTGDVVGARASAEMQGWLHRPFGLENVSIGPIIGLSIEILYAQFLSTGTPSGFGVKGGLLIGEVEAGLAINISEDPRRQLLSGKIEKLNISDVVVFVSKLVDAPIRDVPADFLKFENADVYICPAGVSIGSTVYPQGFSFTADMVLFGKRANIACVVSEAERQMRIDGGVDNFQLGPLSVHGLNGPRAELHCVIGIAKQYLYVDGAISLFDVKTQTSIQLQLLPSPILIFHAQLRFTDLFLIRLDAELIGGVDFKSLGNADFTFDAELQNAILEYIREQVMEQIQGAANVAADGVDAAQEKVDEAQREWRRGVDHAEHDLKDALQAWQHHNKAVRNESQPVIDNYLQSISNLQKDIDDKRKVYKSAMKDAQRAVEIANDDRAAALQAARRDVTKAKADMDRGINAAQRALDYASADLSRAFGDAQRAIDRARRNVQSLQNQINDTWRTVRAYERAPWYEFWKKAAIAGLMVTIGALEASRGVADGVLWAAQAVLRGGEFLSKEAALNTARAGLEAARHTGYASLDTANAALVAADKASQAAVDAAKETLKGVEHGVEFAAFQGAIQALEGFKTANEALYKAAVAAIEALLESMQYIAYQVATNALAVARGATAVLDAAKEMLELAKKATQAALDAIKEVVNFGTRAVDIKRIKLSGTLRGIVGAAGKTAKPLSAQIKGYFLGKFFELHAEFDPRDPVKFITSIFSGLWKGLIVVHTQNANPSLSFAQAVMAAHSHFGSEYSASPEHVAVIYDEPSVDINWFDVGYPVDVHSPFRLALSKRAPSLPLGEPLLGIGSLEKALHIVDRPLEYIPRGPFSGHHIGPVSVREWTAAKVMQEIESVIVKKDKVII